MTWRAFASRLRSPLDDQRAAHGAAGEAHGVGVGGDHVAVLPDPVVKVSDAADDIAREAVCDAAADRGADEFLAHNQDRPTAAFGELEVGDREPTGDEEESIVDRVADAAGGGTG